MFKKIKKVGAVVGASLFSAAVFAQGEMPTGLQTAIDDNKETIGLVAAAMLVIPLAFLGIKLVLRAIRSH